MSAIAGVFHRDGRPVDAGTAAQMLGVMERRGPDSRGTWHDGPLWLGQLMLRTTPESVLERQPLVDSVCGVVLVADARIDNRDDLLAALGVDCPARMTTTDADLVLAAYRKWGEDCPRWLVGDYAFAIWDARHRSLFCARDHLALRPFYYHVSPKLFAFASEIGALLQLPDVPRQLNEFAVAGFLTMDVSDEEATFYAGVQRLPAATAMTVGERGLRRATYWAPDPYRDLGLSSDADYAEALREVFTEAVRCRLRTITPVACTLSGGLDSTSVACTARDLLAATGTALHTYSAIFPSLASADPRIDERQYIDIALATGGFVAHKIEADRLDPLLDFEWQGDEPVLGLNLFMDWAYFEGAKEVGARVFLHGVDGDSTLSHGYELLDDLARAGMWSDFLREIDLLGAADQGTRLRYLHRYGFPHLAPLARRGRWLEFARQVDGISRTFGIGRRSLYGKQGLGRMLVHSGLKPHVPRPVRSLWRKARGHGAGAGERGVLSADMARRLRWAEHVQSLAEPAGAQERDGRQDHALGMTSGLLRRVFEMLDATAAAFAIEPRAPFADRRLMDLCVAMPPSQKLSRGTPRAVMRRAMAGVIPAEIADRLSKQNLSLCLKTRLHQCHAGRLESLLMRDTEAIRPYVDVPNARAACVRYLADPTGCDREVMTVVCVVLLSQWLCRTEALQASAHATPCPVVAS